MADLSNPEGEFCSKSMDRSIDELVPCSSSGPWTYQFTTCSSTEWPIWFGCVDKRILCCYEEFIAYKILDEHDKKWFLVFPYLFCKSMKELVAPIPTTTAIAISSSTKEATTTTTTAVIVEDVMKS
jgi:hypothetical protein